MHLVGSPLDKMQGIAVNEWDPIDIIALLNLFQEKSRIYQFLSESGPLFLCDLQSSRKAFDAVGGFLILEAKQLATKSRKLGAQRLLEPNL